MSNNQSEILYLDPRHDNKEMGTKKEKKKKKKGCVWFLKKCTKTCKNLGKCKILLNLVRNQY